MKDKPGFCYDIFKNQAFASQSDGSLVLQPCCIYDGHLDKDIPAEQSWFGTNHKKIIKLVENGQPIPGCHVCYKQEAGGFRSRRQADAEHYKSFLKSEDIDSSSTGPVSLDYSVGNLCNLKCVICGPGSSTAWIPDYQKMYPDRDASKFYFKKDTAVEIKNPDFLKNIRSVHFHGGGEPLLGDAHLRLLLQIEQVKGLHDVRVSYNTNGTQIADQKVLDLWSRCQLIELYFSIDDIGQRFDYQRKGARWSEVCDNLRWTKQNLPHNHMFKVNCVWSYLNLFYLDQLVDWHHDNFSCNRYGDPCDLIFQRCSGQFDIKHISDAAYKILSSKFAQYPSLIKILNDIDIDDKKHTVFWEKIISLDEIRKTSFKEICPEWSALLS